MDEQEARDALDREAEREAQDLVTTRYRRRIGVTLALLALLGSWIAVLATNAGTNESRTTREATRLAADAQTADVLAKGIRSGLDQIDAEIGVLPLRPAFDTTSGGPTAVVDPTDQEQRLAEARAKVDQAIPDRNSRGTEVDERATSISLGQTALVAERVTWNNRASQYETVLTALAVAVFLTGFSLVVSPGLRHFFAVPGIVLGVTCFAWAIQIYLKPVPEVAQEAIDRTAAGEVALDEGRPDDAVVEFTAAIEADDDYAVAYRGLGGAIVVAANPDLLRTWAITDSRPEVTDAAFAALDRAMELDPEDAATLAAATIAAVVASDWDRAAELADEALRVNDRSPGLELARSAVAIAQGDEATADDQLGRALDQAVELEGTNTDRALGAQYLTLLEWVERQAPEQADLVGEFRTEAMETISRRRAAATPSVVFEPGVVPPDATLDVERLEFVDGVTTVDLASSGVPDSTQVLIAIYERPSVDGPWVQAPELFYVGLAVAGGGITLDTPRACHPVEYRVDLYLNGLFAASAEGPGVAPTC